MSLVENPADPSGSESKVWTSPRWFIWSCFCSLFAGEADSITGRCQRSFDECSQSAEGTLQHADPQRDIPHQPQQTADYREWRVQKQQQLLDGLSFCVQIFKDRTWRSFRDTGGDERTTSARRLEGGVGVRSSVTGRSPDGGGGAFVITVTDRGGACKQGLSRPSLCPVAGTNHYMTISRNGLHSNHHVLLSFLTAEQSH